MLGLFPESGVVGILCEERPLGHILFHCAADGRNLRVMEYMLKRLTAEEARAVARRRDMFGITPIKYAVYPTAVEVAELLCSLLNQKARDDAMCDRDRSGATLLHTIATLDPPGVKRILIFCHSSLTNFIELSQDLTLFLTANPIFK